MVLALLNAIGFDRGNDDPICVRFTNTVGARLGPKPVNRLNSPEVLEQWMSKHGLLDASVGLDAAHLDRALALREALFGIFSAMAAEKPPQAEDVDTLNGELVEALAKIELTDSLEWSLAERDAAERAFMLIALSGAGLITSDDSARIRICAGDTCGWVLIDHSKNRSRRWCSMSDCGNLEKARRFQARRKERTATGE